MQYLFVIGEPISSMHSTGRLRLTAPDENRGRMPAVRGRLARVRQLSAAAASQLVTSARGGTRFRLVAVERRRDAADQHQSLFT